MLSLVENVYSCSNHEIITTYCYFYVKYTHADTIAINRNRFYMIRTAVPENGNARIYAFKYCSHFHGDSEEWSLNVLFSCNIKNVIKITQRDFLSNGHKFYGIFIYK